jgi:plastocyanin
MTGSLLRSALVAWGLATAGAAGAASLTVRVTDAANAPVDDAVVYAIPSVPSTKAPQPAEVGQIAKAFTPLVSVVQTGTLVSFPNRDTVKHQIYSFSPAKVFQLKLYAGLPAAPIQFDKAGLVVLGCNIHDAMVAYILVVDTPYFGKTGTNGVVRIDGLPAGEYKLSSWHPRMSGPEGVRAINVANDLKIDQVIELKS